LFVVAASIVTALLAGALPAIRAGRADLNDALKEGGRSDGGSVGVRTRRLLIVCEVALSVVLLMGAGVMIRSLVALRSVDAGFDPRNVLTMYVRLPQTRYPTPAQRSAFFDNVLQRFRALPGVESAGAIDDLPTQGGSVQPLVVEGKTELLPRDQPTVQVRKITPGYLKTLRIPLLRGRDVAENDVEVMLVSRSAARLLWGEVDPIGRHATLPLQSRTVVKEVIGIVGDVKQEELSGSTAPSVYEYTRERDLNGYQLALRTTVPPASLGQTAVGVIHAIDAEQPVEDVRPMQDMLDETLTSQRFSALLLAMFADVARLVVAEGMTPAIIGIVLGTLAALVSARLLERLVFGVSASDPLTLAAVAGTLTAVALLASLLPAWRASRLDPLKVLRAE